MSTNLWQALEDAFADSSYLHSPGSGNMQSLELVIEQHEGLDTDEEQVAYIAGAIAAMALCDQSSALRVAQNIVDGEYDDESDDDESDDADGRLMGYIVSFDEADDDDESDDLEVDVLEDAGFGGQDVTLYRERR